MRKLSISIAAIALALVGVAGCSNTSPDTGSGSDTGSPGAEAKALVSTLTTAESDLGTIVVDDKGMVVYVYDQDTQGSGESSCTGQCLTNWPPVTADALPSLDGVTAAVESITGTDGSTQVTLDGKPLYYYAGDAAAGDTTGQGVDNVWWVVGPDGKKITG